MKQMRDVLGDDGFNTACRRADKRSLFILRPSLMKHFVKRMLSESSPNLLSGYKVEDHQHAMECFHVLVFHRVFRGPERKLLKCPAKNGRQGISLVLEVLVCHDVPFYGRKKAVVTADDSHETI